MAVIVLMIAMTNLFNRPTTTRQHAGAWV